MKAPEIIFINGFSAFATEPVKDGVQYIRKDVLINWLKEHINDYLVHGRDIDLMFDDIKNEF